MHVGTGAVSHCQHDSMRHGKLVVGHSLYDEFASATFTPALHNYAQADAMCVLQELRTFCCLLGIDTCSKTFQGPCKTFQLLASRDTMVSSL